MSVTLADIHAAATRLAPVVRRTPLLRAPLLDALAGRRVWVKPECLQWTGSFKFRGAWSALTQLPEGTGGVLAFSSGNHAQAVAYAAQRLGREAVIVMPADAPALKIANTRAYGAEVILYDRARVDRDVLGAEIAEARGLALVPPFDHPQVIAGQGTIGLELASAARAQGITQAQVLVCCGGGGLISGIALALAHEAPDLRVHPVEPEGFDDVTKSLAAGEIIRHPLRTGLCDAIVTPAPGALTWPILQRHCGPGLVVSDRAALAAMALAFRHLKLVLEPGGAVALAASLVHRRALKGEDVIVIASGGNVDADIFARALKEESPDAFG